MSDSTIKKTIEHACAELRVAGVHVFELFVQPEVFRELERDPLVRKHPSADSETTLSMLTCNGPTLVKLL